MKYTENEARGASTDKDNGKERNAANTNNHVQ